MSEMLPPACVESDRVLVDLAFDETATIDDSVRQHVASCARCTRVLTELKEARSAAELPLEAPSMDVDRGVLAALDAHLAGEKVDRFIKLPEPERALGAERLVRHLSVPPRPRTAEAPAPAAEEQRPARPARARRRWTGGFLAAASVALVAGGALYLNENGGSKLTARPEEEAAAPAPPPSAPAPAAASTAAPEAPAIADGVAQPKANAGAGDALAPVAAQKAEESRKKGVAPPSVGLIGLRDSRQDSAGASGGLALQDSAAAPAAKKAMRREVQNEAKDSAAPAGDSAPDFVARAPAMPAPTPMRVAEGGAGSAVAEAKEKAVAPALRKADESDSDASSPWTRALMQARAAAARKDHRTAARAYGEVLAAAGIPSPVEQEALKGQLDALLALHRFDEAEAVAGRLASKYPAQVSARERVSRAKADAAGPAAAAPPAAAAAPAEMQAPATEKASQ